MADSQAPQESVELEKTPAGGWRGKLTGQNLTAIITAAALSLGAWVMIDHRNESRAAMVQLGAKQEKALSNVADALNKNAEEQAVMNYILTLSQEERQKLRLDMPASLRARMR